MSDTLTESGSLNIEPTTGQTDGVLSVAIPMDLRLTLKGYKPIRGLILSTDAAVSIALENLAAVHWLHMHVVGGGAKLSFTNTYGAQNEWVEPKCTKYMKTTAPITGGIQVTRPPGVQVTVDLYLGEKA